MPGDAKLRAEREVDGDGERAEQEAPAEGAPRRAGVEDEDHEQRQPDQVPLLERLPGKPARDRVRPAEGDRLEVRRDDEVDDVRGVLGRGLERSLVKVAERV